MRHEDHDAEFVEFVGAERARLVRMARLLTAGDEAQAEDVVQTTLTKLYLGWSKVRRADNRLGYARTALTNTFIDETRRAHRRRETPVDDPMVRETAVTQHDPVVRDVVRVALAELAPRQRAVVVLRHWLDLDVTETARILGCSTGTDLTRARAARSRQRRRRYSAGLAALSLAAVAGVGAAIAVDGPGSGSTPSASPNTTAPTAAPAVRLVAQPLVATPYTFDLSPDGWSVQAITPSAVLIVPSNGSTSADPNDFQGKLAILFDANPLEGEQVTSEGRTFWVGASSGYTQMATPTLPGEPDGVVRIQFPASAGWTRATMLRFLGSVHVGAGAEQGVG